MGVPAQAGVVAVSSGSGAVYATATSSYVTFTAYKAERGASAATSVHRFDPVSTFAASVASGAVVGRLLYEFLVHARSGVLLVASIERANGTSSPG